MCLCLKDEGIYSSVFCERLNSACQMENTDKENNPKLFIPHLMNDSSICMYNLYSSPPQQTNAEADKSILVGHQESIYIRVRISHLPCSALNTLLGSYSYRFSCLVYSLSAYTPPAFCKQADYFMMM